MTDTPARIHTACGNPMTPAVFGPHDPKPQYRSQPIWTCGPCGTWEPSEGWGGPLPADWDGIAWKGQDR